MTFFVAFFALVLSQVLFIGNNAMARLASPSHEEGPALKSKYRTSPNVTKVSSEGDRRNTGRGSGQTRGTGRGGKNQGQATSTAYDKADFTISIDVGVGEHEDTMAENAASGGPAGGEDKMPGQSTYSTAASLTGASAISATALSRAKAADALKKKLQAENKKKLQLQDVSGEKSNNDPRQDIINKLVEASQDIEK